MVWIDSDKNEYRRLVLPLAQRQPVLLLAILAISSQHLAVTQNEESSFSGYARDAAVSMISGQIRQVTGRLAAGHDLGGEIDADTAEWILASMLTLASYEMAESEAGVMQQTPIGKLHGLWSTPLPRRIVTITDCSAFFETSFPSMTF